MSKKSEVAAALSTAFKPDKAGVMIDLDKITVGDNVRDGGDVQELANTIKTQGQLQAVAVQLVGPDKYDLIFGHRRLAAVKANGDEKIRSDIYSGLSEANVALLKAVENCHRKPMNPMEEAHAFKRFCGDDGVETASKMLGLTPGYVRTRLDLLALPKDLHPHIATGRLPVSHAYWLCRIGDSQAALDLGFEVMGDYGHGEGTPAERVAATEYTMPMRDLKKAVVNMAGSLGGSRWPLVPGYAGKRACFGCPSNSATEPGLFEAIEMSSKTGNCTNPECYTVKAETWAKEKGAKRAAEAKEIEAALKRGAEICATCGRPKKLKEAAWPKKSLCPKCHARAEKKKASGYHRPDEKPWPLVAADFYARDLYNYFGDMAGVAIEVIEGKVRGLRSKVTLGEIVYIFFAGRASVHELGKSQFTRGQLVKWLDDAGMGGFNPGPDMISRLFSAGFHYWEPDRYTPAPDAETESQVGVMEAFLRRHLPAAKWMVMASLRPDKRTYDDAKRKCFCGAVPTEAKPWTEYSTCPACIKKGEAELKAEAKAKAAGKPVKKKVKAGKKK